MGQLDTTFTQLIEIIDNQGPEVMCQSTLAVTTNTLIQRPGGSYGDFDCGANVRIPLPSASDNCSNDFEFDLSFNSGFINDYRGENVELPMGTNVVLFTVYDECFNSSTCHIAVDIQDNTPPVPICDQNTVVSLTNAGTAFVRSESFDDGSYDDCKLECSLVRRMDNNGCTCLTPEICNLDFIGNFQGSNYYLSDELTTANTASRRSIAYGGSLVSFQSMDEQDWLEERVRSNNTDAFWIGLKRNNGSFLWEDHAPLSFNNFIGGVEPMMGGDCAILGGNGYWQARGCSSEAGMPNVYRYVLEIPEGCGFSNGVQFCCEDVGMDHLVMLRAVDRFGNHNDCMVNISVQDKSAPTLTCPPNQTVSCQMIFDLNNLDVTFGTLDIGESCGSIIVPTVTEDFNDCGIGTLTRLYEAVASQEPGSQVLAQCKQVITFENNDPFPIENIICPEVTVNLDGCDDPDNFGPDVTGVPEFTTGICDRLGTDFNDKVFTFNNDEGDACFKILRDWRIVDWCRIDPSTGTFFEASCNQVIQITNSARPVISGDQKVNICSFDDDCDSADVTLQVRGEDDCTIGANLVWRYEIFVGTISAFPSTTGTADIVVDGTGDLLDASGNYPVGNHIIRYTYFDGCGNSTTTSQEFTVANCRAATSYCLSGVAIDLMPIDDDGDGVPDFGMIELWANDFDAGSSHPCGYPVILSFSADPNDTNKSFTCATRGPQEVNIWASVLIPNGDLVQTFCTTFVDIQDNMGLCTGLSVAVDGNIFTEEQRNVENVEVSLVGSAATDYTSVDGEYAFPKMPTGGDYSVDPYSNEDASNGISTLDLIRIQRHILGLETLDSPYKHIAADIDNNKIINGTDLVELRKLILGIYTEFPNNDSWKFVDKEYAFTNSNDPLLETYPQQYEITNLERDMNIDFIAVKIGDVNNSAEVNLQSQGRIQNTNGGINVVVGKIEEANALGDLITIPLMLDTDTEVQGFQFALEYDNHAMDVIGVNGLGIELASSNYIIEDDRILISWNGDSTDDLGLEIVATAKNTFDGQSTSVAISLDGNVAPEVYNNQGLILKPTINQVESSITNWISKNVPNPFSDNTQVTLSFDTPTNVVLSITDISGRKVLQEANTYNAGTHVVNISADQLTGAGVYYMTIQSEVTTETIKMVLID